MPLLPSFCLLFPALRIHLQFHLQALFSSSAALRVGPHGYDGPGGDDDQGKSVKRGLLFLSSLLGQLGVAGRVGPDLRRPGRENPHHAAVPARTHGRTTPRPARHLLLVPALQLALHLIVLLADR